MATQELCLPLARSSFRLMYIYMYIYTKGKRVYIYRVHGDYAS